MISFIFTLVAAPIVMGESPVTLVCEEEVVTQTDANFGSGFRQSSRKETQEYRVDPKAASVTSRFAYKSEAEPWIEQPTVASTFLRTPAGRLVFCLVPAPFKCESDNTRTTQTGSTIVSAPEKYVLDLRTGVLTGFQFMSVKGNDGSSIQTASQIAGLCRSRPAGRS